MILEIWIFYTLHSFFVCKIFKKPLLIRDLISIIFSNFATWKSDIGAFNTNAAAEILVKDKIFEQQEFIDSKFLTINLKKI